MPGLMIYRFTHNMYYANSQVLEQEVVELVREPTRRCPGSVSMRPRSTTWTSRRPKPCAHSTAF